MPSHPLAIAGLVEPSSTCEQMSVLPVTDICTLIDTILAVSVFPRWWQRHQHKLVSVLISGAREREYSLLSQVLLLRTVRKPAALGLLLQ